jgi:hypothetical protein
MTSKSTRHRFNLFAVGVAMALLICAGCGRDATSASADVRASDMRELAGKGDRESIDALVDGLEDDSELVRRDAQRALSEVLKRKIYFDPSAPAQERARAITSVRSMWQNLQEKDIVEAAKERVPLRYYYDLNTGEVFEDISHPGPIETPSGLYQGMPAGVRVVMFACRDCGDETDRYVGWLEVPVTALKQYDIAFTSADDLDRIDERRACRKPDGGEWALFGTPEAESIAAEGRRCENRDVPLMCRPGR